MNEAFLLMMCFSEHDGPDKGRVCLVFCECLVLGISARCITASDLDQHARTHVIQS